MSRVVRWLSAVVLVATACAASGRPRPVVMAWRTGFFPPGASVASAAYVGPPGSSAAWMAVGAISAGNGDPATGCFLSPTGLSWTPCPLRPIDTDGRRTRLLGVARLGSRVIAGGVAVGALHGNPRPYLWAGPVGGTLEELNLPRELFGGENIISYTGLASGPLGGFGAGSYVGITNQPVAQVWRTADGSDWQRLDGVASLTGSSEEILRGTAIADGPDRAVLVGAAIDLRRLADRDDGAVWWSDDGSSWHRADLAGSGMIGPGAQELRAVDAVDDRGAFTAGGSNGDRAAVWTSPDGRSWHAARRLPDGRGAGATVTALASAPTGRRWAAGVVAGAPRLWTSADGTTWAAVALPAMAGATLGAVQGVTITTGAGQLLMVVQGTAGSLAAVTPL